MSDEAIRTTGGSHDEQDRSPVHSNASAAQEIERLRDRLTYYESFDRLIQENIARSGELMRDALDLRERTQAELTRERKEVERSRRETERRMEAERTSHRAVLAGLVDELDTVRESAERLTRRVAEAVGGIGTDTPRLGSGGETLPLAPGGGGDTFGRSDTEPYRSEAEVDATVETRDEPMDRDAFAVPADGEFGQVEARLSEQESVIALPAAEAEVAPPEGSSGQETPGGADVGEGAGPFAWSDDYESAAPERRSSGPVDADEADATAVNVEAISPASHAGAEDQVEARDWGGDAASSEPEEVRAITVLVHGVPRAATALSLQRHLAGLDHVSGVEAREYAEGVLRLQVTSLRPLRFEDLESWEDGRGVQPVHLHSDVLEVRLPGADF